MIRVQRFINQLLSSNCFIIFNDETKRAVVIDPGSEKSENEIKFIEFNNLKLDYIMLTHEHADHTWGVNSLLNRYPDAKVICSSLCRDNLPQEVRYFFQLYFDNVNYVYNLKHVDYTTEELNWNIDWSGIPISFISVPGHTLGSICISVGNNLFSGDTLIRFKPLIRKRNGGSFEMLHKSIQRIIDVYPKHTQVYPGHGEAFRLDSYDLK